MKKIFLGVGAFVSVATPLIAMVSCSAGSVFKSKINSLDEAKEDVEKILDELKHDGKLSKDLDRYTSALSADEIVVLENGLTRDMLKNLDYGNSVKEMKLEQGKRNFGFADWSGTHNDYSSKFKVILEDKRTAFIYVHFKYDKTNGVITTGKKSLLVNAAIGVVNATQKLKHVIDKIAISTKEIEASN